MKTLLLGLSLSAIALAFIGGCAAQKTPDQSQQAVVEMHFHSFEPKSVTIHAGETVLWRNTTLFIPHTVTDDPAEAESPEHVALPPGAEKFDSGYVASGGTWQHVFTVAGTYKYVCKPHESKGMVGEVIVLPAQTVTEPAAQPATTPTTTQPAAP